MSVPPSGLLVRVAYICSWLYESDAVVPVLPVRLLLQRGTSSHHPKGHQFLSFFTCVSCFVSHMTSFYSSSVDVV